MTRSSTCEWSLLSLPAVRCVEHLACYAQYIEQVTGAVLFIDLQYADSTFTYQGNASVDAFPLTKWFVVSIVLLDGS